MRARVDLHFHLLPEVDDGPATIEESVALARAAADQGTGTIVATPHVRSDFITDVRDLPERVRALRERLLLERVPVRVLCGAEVGHELVGRLTQADLELIAIGPPGARWILFETPFEGIDGSVHSAAEELRDRGFGVVLAHPERSDRVLENDAAALRLERSRGSAVQVNAHSLTGLHGPAAEAAATLLLRTGAVEAVASDAHSRVRGPALEAGLAAAAGRGVPEGIARRATDFAPVRLVLRGLDTRVAVATA